MNMRVSLAAAAAALLGAAPASALVIDDFTTFQSVADLTTGDGGVGSEVAAPEALGGWRDLYVEKVEGPEGTGTRAVSTGDTLSFSNDSQVRGRGWLTWDGLDDDPLGVNTTGLGGVDLLSFGPAFLFDVAHADHMLAFTMRVWDMAGELSEYTEILPPVDQLDTTLPFSDFEGGADFSNVGALQIFVDTRDQVSLDASIDRVEVIPLPASALLLLGGLGGLGALRARRRSA